MADRALRGMQIGSKSMESEDGVIFADRFTARYVCTNGHEQQIPFAAEATPPTQWECKCGAMADLVGETGVDDEVKTAKPVRTHWDMLLERRSTEELEELLNEQLTLLREGRLRPEINYRS